MVFSYQRSTIKYYLFFSVVLIWSASVYYVLNLADRLRGTNPWRRTEFASNGTGDIQWCERRRPLDLLIEPSNAMSNFAYIFVGLLMFHIGIYDQFFYHDPNKDKKSIMIQHPIFSFTYGVAAILLGICSFLMHASNLPHHGHWDVSSMYACVLYPFWLLLFQLFQWLPQSKYFFLFCHWAATYAFFAFGSPWNDQQTMINIIVLLLVMTAFNYFWFYKERVFYVENVFGAIASIVIGFGLWNLEKLPGWCNPDTVFQLHSVWHVATAIGIFFIHIYARTEEKRDPEDEYDIHMSQKIDI